MTMAAQEQSAVGDVSIKASSPPYVCIFTFHHKSNYRVRRHWPTFNLREVNCNQKLTCTHSVVAHILVFLTDCVHAWTQQESSF